MMTRRFHPGIDALLSRHKEWLAGRRVGLVSHLAATDFRGRTSAERLWKDEDVGLVCLFGPEHGFYGTGAAGAACRDTMHRDWTIPVFSLYGRTKKPTPAMLRKIDALVYDIQDLGARPYTYVSTLRYVLEAAAEMDREVIVADRPVPLPGTVDGPVTRKKFISFVSLVDTSMSYGMTPGETALWLKDRLGLNLRLRVAKMSGYARQQKRGTDWPAWVPPSPAIVSWESAMCFPAAVCFEALPSVGHGRRTGRPFQLIGAEWMNGVEVAEFLRGLKLPGVRFHAHSYDGRPRQAKRKALNGIRMEVISPNRFKPIMTAVSIVHCLQVLYGKKRVWAKARPGFFDKLFGTDMVRKALLDGEDGVTVAARWKKDLAGFNETRKKCLLY